ncbi:DUF5133 domain-containing protein [Streptacidiphilus sp. P02-A3a]|uniref:DUF5133 domain-containing protein n=1 Tax=Streptacidiphilus sp. P02-A3a TaxID=2704468 RepID=UPI0015F9D509|nr:DUF5133 domain-containing protein [Streptacidiphilus sp. P02-A3a]QMU69637.1 DUF5133 domain-containing protein [Streptacidiphilus sp. P02-A3a]
MPLINLPLLDRLVADLDALRDRPEAGARREDLYYTLCVSTGVREPEQALARARGLLASHRAQSLATAA